MWWFNTFNVNVTTDQKAVASGRTRGRDVHTSCLLWDLRVLCG